MAELRSGAQFRLKLKIVSLKFLRKTTSNVSLRFIKDYFHAIKISVFTQLVYFFSGNTILTFKSI